MPTANFATSGANASTRATPVTPVSLISQWVNGRQANVATNLATADTGGVINPETDIADARGCVVSRADLAGTNIVCRVRYIASTVTTSPVIRCFGRHSSQDAWGTCRTKSGSLTLTLACDTVSDDADGTFRYSVPTALTEAFDTMGYNEFTFGVVTAFAGTSVTHAHLQVRFI